MRYFTDSILLLLYSTLTFFYVPADQALVFALLFAVILCCITYLCRVCKTESCSHNSLPVLKPAGNIIPVLAGSYVIFSSVFPAAAVSDLICRAFSSGSGCASTLGISGFSDQ